MSNDALTLPSVASDSRALQVEAGHRSKSPAKKADVRREHIEQNQAHGNVLNYAARRVVQVKAGFAEIGLERGDADPVKLRIAREETFAG